LDYLNQFFINKAFSNLPAIKLIAADDPQNFLKMFTFYPQFNQTLPKITPFLIILC
jgi:hypothetical protein